MSEFFNNIYQSVIYGNLNFWEWFIVNIVLFVIIQTVSYVLQWITYRLWGKDKDFAPEFVHNGPEQAAGCYFIFALLCACFCKVGCVILCVYGVVTLIDGLNEVSDGIAVQRISRRKELSASELVEARNNFDEVQKTRKEKGVKPFPNYDVYLKYVKEHGYTNIFVDENIF